MGRRQNLLCASPLSPFCILPLTAPGPLLRRLHPTTNPTHRHLPPRPRLLGHNPRLRPRSRLLPLLLFHTLHRLGRYQSMALGDPENYLPHLARRLCSHQAHGRGNKLSPPPLYAASLHRRPRACPLAGYYLCGCTLAGYRSPRRRGTGKSPARRR